MREATARRRVGFGAVAAGAIALSVLGGATAASAQPGGPDAASDVTPATASALATIDATPFDTYYASYWGGDVEADTTAFEITLPPRSPRFPDVPLTWTILGVDDAIVNQGSLAAGTSSFVAPVPAGSSLPHTVLLSDAAGDTSVSVAVTILLATHDGSPLPTSVIDLSTQRGVLSSTSWFTPTASPVPVEPAAGLVVETPGPWFTEGLDAGWTATEVKSVEFGQKAVPSDRTPLGYEVSADGTRMTVTGLDAFPSSAWEGEPAVTVAIGSDTGILDFRRAVLTVPLRLAEPAPVPVPSSPTSSPVPAPALSPSSNASDATRAATLAATGSEGWSAAPFAALAAGLVAAGALVAGKGRAARGASRR